MTSPVVSPRGARGVGPTSPSVRLVALFFCLLLAIAALIQPLARRDGDNPAAALAALLKSTSDGRTVEARLSGGFRHSPMRSGTAAPRSLAFQSSVLLAASASAQQAALADPSAARLHVWGLSQLLLGDYDGAVASLRAAAEDAGTDARYFSDLAAALLARAQALDRPEDLPLALDAAEHAAALGDGPEIRFNRAFALEALHLDRLALAEWDTFLASDSSSGWAEEARRRAQLLRDRPLGLTWAPGQVVTRQTAFRAREWLFGDAMPQWAKSRLGGNTVPEVNAQTQDVIRQLGMISGDQSIVAIGEELKVFAGERAADLARGFLALGESMAASRADRFGDIIKHTYESCAAFRAARSRFASACEVEEAAAAILERKVDVALASIERLLPVLRENGFNASEARALWLRARLSITQQRLAESKPMFRRARELYEQAGEWVAAGRMWSQESEMAYASGHFDEYWRLRLRALDLAALGGNVVASFSALASSSAFLINEGKFRPAARMAEAALSPFGDELPPAMRLIPTEFLLVSSVQAGDLPRARHARDEINRLVEGSRDPRLPELLVEIKMALASLARAEGDLERAEVALSSAIATTVPERYLSTRLWGLLDRANVRFDLHRDDDAAADVKEAIELLASRRDAGGVSLRMAELGRLRKTAARVALRGDSPGWDDLLLFDRSRTALRSDVTPPPADASQALQLIPADTAIAVFAEDGLRVSCWILTARGVRYQRLAIPADGLKRMVTRISALAESSDPDADWTPTLSAMYAALLGPIEKELEAATRLVIVPDGLTRAMPFAMLMSPAGQPAAARWRIARAASVAAALAVGASTHSPAARSILVVGDPSSTNEDALPGARQEAATIAGLYGGTSRTASLDGDEATRQRIQAEIGSVSIIHFAGHAVSNPANPGRSYLQLAPDATSADGRWFMSDLRSGQFSRNQLVILAACSSAEAGFDMDDSVATVAEAVLRAGAGAVIATLWPLPDEASGPVFVELHRNLLRGLEPDEALRETLLHLWRTGNSSPGAWAGLQLFTESAEWRAPQ
jgi:CHAT domain-containing protein